MLVLKIIGIIVNLYFVYLSVFAVKKYIDRKIAFPWLIMLITVMLVTINTCMWIYA